MLSYFDDERRRVIVELGEGLPAWRVAGVKEGFETWRRDGPEGDWEADAYGPGVALLDYSPPFRWVSDDRFVPELTPDDPLKFVWGGVKQPLRELVAPYREHQLLLAKLCLRSDDASSVVTRNVALTALLLDHVVAEGVPLDEAARMVGTYGEERLVRCVVPELESPADAAACVDVLREISLSPNNRSRFLPWLRRLLLRQDLVAGLRGAGRIQAEFLPLLCTLPAGGGVPPFVHRLFDPSIHGTPLRKLPLTFVRARQQAGVLDEDVPDSPRRPVQHSSPTLERSPCTVCVVGHGALGRAVADRLAIRPELGYRRWESAAEARIHVASACMAVTPSGWLDRRAGDPSETGCIDPSSLAENADLVVLVTGLEPDALAETVAFVRGIAPHRIPMMAIAPAPHVCMGGGKALAKAASSFRALAEAVPAILEIPTGVLVERGSNLFWHGRPELALRITRHACIGVDTLLRLFLLSPMAGIDRQGFVEALARPGRWLVAHAVGRYPDPAAGAADEVVRDLLATQLPGTVTDGSLVFTLVSGDVISSGDVAVGFGHVNGVLGLADYHLGHMDDPVLEYPPEVAVLVKLTD